MNLRTDDPLTPDKSEEDAEAENDVFLDILSDGEETVVDKNCNDVSKKSTPGDGDGDVLCYNLSTSSCVRFQKIPDQVAKQALEDEDLDKLKYFSGYKPKYERIKSDINKVSLDCPKCMQDFRQNACNFGFYYKVSLFKLNYKRVLCL